MTAIVPKEIQVGGVDPVKMYLLLSSSHDGSRAFTVAITPIRVVCLNTLNLGTLQATQSWSIRHTETADGRVEEARKALGMTFKYADEFEAEANRLIDAEFTKMEFEKLVKQLVPERNERDDSGRQTRMAMIGTLESSPTISDDFRYTKWGALQAVAEYQDWVRPMRSSKTKSEAEQRSEAMWGANQAVKNRAFELLTK